LAAAEPRLPAAFTPAQVSYLDFLRGVASLFVLVGHSGIAFRENSWLASGHLQSLGVITFFLISGFLITSSVLNRSLRPGYGFAPYIIDRFFRIFTAYVPALILVAVVDAFVFTLPSYPYRSDYDVPTWFANLLMLQDYPIFQVLRRIGVDDQWWFFGPFGSGRPFWTVAIEWWIYLLFGWIVFFGRSKWPTTLVVWSALALMVVPGYHFVGGYAQCLTMLWLLGMAAAYFWHTQPSRAARYPLLATHGGQIGFGIFAFGLFCMAGRLFANNGLIYELQFALFFAVSLFGIFLMLGRSLRTIPKLIRVPVGFLAEFSYSLYLTHFSLVVFVQARYPDRADDPDLFWGVIGASLVLAIVFWALFERHHRVLARMAKAGLAKWSSPYVLRQNSPAESASAERRSL
jgi:peptidoglycan/LPS O-acetylase OafA/YrhL